MSFLIPNRLQKWLSNQPAPPSTPSPSHSNSSPCSHPHSAHEVYHVAFLLRQVLIPDLIPHILNLAEYWTMTSYVRCDAQAVVASTAGRPYLTGKVSGMGGASGPRMVRKVEINITCRDQGWSNYPELHGTYEGCWTWFEAEIELSGRMGEEGSERVTKGLCRNVHAGKEDRFYRIHLVEWRYDAEDKEERNLVRSLRPGSVISVVPWARCPGWKNIVSQVSVYVYTAAIRGL